MFSLYKMVIFRDLGGEIKRYDISEIEYGIVNVNAMVIYDGETRLCERYYNYVVEGGKEVIIDKLSGCKYRLGIGTNRY